MRHVAVAALAAALIPCACALSGCAAKSSTTTASGQGAKAASGTNANLTQAELLTRLQDALADVTALHMKGKIIEDGSTTTVDMQLNKDGSSQGTMVTPGATVPIIVVDGVTYTQVTSSYAVSSPSASDAKVGDWVELTGQAASSATDFGLMLQELDSPSKYSYTYQGTSTVGGRSVAQYKEVPVGTGVEKVLSIPLSGAALPISVDGGAAGTFTFAWNQPTKVVAPPPSKVVVAPSS